MELNTVPHRQSVGEQECSDHRATVVIADSGATAAVLVIESRQRLAVGSRFRHRGEEWRIVGRRPHSRALVAKPVNY
jgi:hypothetical protein